MLEIIDPAALGMQPLDMSGILAARAEAEAKCKGCEAYRPEPQLSGNLQCDPEISLLSPGFPVEVGYYYNASSGVNGPFGFGRTISPNLTAQASGSPMLVTLTRDNGAQVSYAYSSGTGGYVAQTPGVLNTLTQDTTDSLWKETTLDGMVTAYPLDTAGHITSAAYIQDAVGNTHSHIYSSGLLQNIQDPAGRLVTFGWSGGLLQSIEDWAARRTTFLYNTASASPLNLLTTVTGPTGCQTGYQYATYTQFSPSGVYSSKWLMSGIVSPNGYGTSYLYDMQSRVINRIIQGVGTYTYLYSPGFMTTIDPMGGILTQAVGGDFQLNSVQDQLGNITTYTRNANLQETSRQSPTGGIWSTNYDSAGRVTSQVSPLGFRVTNVYDPYSNILSVQTPDGAIVTNVYGHAGSSFDTTGAKRKLQAQTNQLGFTTSMGYNSRGQAAWQQDAAGFIVSMNRDSFGNPISRQDAMGGLWSASFDLAGNPLTQTNPLNAVWSQTWDNMNRPLVSIDPIGNSVTNAYDSVGNRTVAISPMGFRTSWLYNAFDKPVSRQDALGNMWTTVYDALGREIASVDPLNNRSTTFYDPLSRTIGQMNPLGAIWTTLRDAGGRPIASQTPLGFLSTTVWDMADRQIASVDGLGNRSTAILDANGRTIANQNPLGFLSSTIFDAASQPVGQIDANNNFSSTVYDPRGLPVAQIDALNRVSSTIYNGNQFAVSQQNPAGYISTAILDSANRNIANLDARGYLSSTIFDAANRPIAQVNALNFRSSTVYNSDSKPVQMTDQLNRVSSTIYDALDRTIASVSPLGYINSVNWDTAGRQISRQNEIGALYTSIWDAASNQIASVSPLGFRSTTVFDAANQPIAEQDSLNFLSSIIWDQAGRRSASINPLNFRSSVVYDQASQQVGSIDPLGNRVTNVFLPNGWQSAVQNELGYLTSFVRDAAGQQICVVDSNSGRSTSLYNSRGLVYATQDQLSALTSFSFDANGNTIQRVDARNWPTSYTVDPLNRTASQIYIDGTMVTNTWDAAGQQLTRVDVTGITSFVWDLDSRKTATQNPTGINLTNTLDPAGNRLVLADLYGVTSYTWDIQSRLTKIQNPLNEVTSIQWDPLDREQHRVLGNGMAVSHTYDGAGRETLLQNISAAGIGQAIFTNTYSPVDNRLTVLELSGVQATYAYDASSQILSEARGGTMAYSRTYVWDPLGNRIQQYDSGVLTQGTFYAANRQTLIAPASGAPTTQTFDPNGNLAVQNTGGSLTTQTWSPDNKLVGVASPTENESYLCSDDGLRRQQTTASGVTAFTYDEMLVLLETSGGALQARNTDYPGYFGGLASQNRGGVSSFYGADSQQSVRILVSGAGSITDAYSSTAFGEPLQTGSGTVNPHRYIGLQRYRQQTNGFYLLSLRVVNPFTGQFTSVDPIGFSSGAWNLYGYAMNNPLRYVDPSGLDPGFTCKDRSKAYCDSASKTGSLFDKCACDTSKLICNIITNPFFTNEMRLCMNCLNACIFNHWKNRDTGQWKGAGNTCSRCGITSEPCCTAMVMAEQSGLTTCEKTQCQRYCSGRGKIMPPANQPEPIRISYGIEKCCNS